MPLLRVDSLPRFGSLTNCGALVSPKNRCDVVLQLNAVAILVDRVGTDCFSVE